MPAPLGVAEAAELEKERTRSGLLANRDFARLWTAHTLSTLGDRIHQVALTWWTLATTGSLALTGAMLIATTLPAVLLGPVAGAVADRWPRKRLMIVCDLLRGVVVMGLAALFWTHTLTPGVMLVASAFLATFTAFFTPAAMALVPSLVKESDVLRATAWMEGSLQGMGILGPALGGVLVALGGAGGAFAANGVSFIVSAGLLLTVSMPKSIAMPINESFTASMAGGFRLLGRDKAVGGALAGFAAVNLFTTPVLLFMPYFAKDVFHTGATGLGALEAALGAGMVLAAVIWAHAPDIKRRFPLVVGWLAGVGLMVLAMGLWPRYDVHLAALALAGLFMGSVNVVMLAFFQARVPPAELGRFFGVMTSLTMGLVPIAFGGYGLLASIVSPASLLVGNGLAILLVSLAFFGNSELRKN
jgi:DHA3 family macrolide efflux protein-like MFS transporter